MIHTVKGILLHHVKFKESSAIIHIYTDKYGRQSYLVNSIRGKRSKYPGNLLQPLTLLEIEAYHKEGRDLQKLKEIRSYHPYRSIPFDLYKSSQSLFLAEVLYKVLREEEPNSRLFEFLESSLELLDVSDSGMINFHLLFLLQLTRYLGFYPHKDYEELDPVFDMRSGHFMQGKVLHPDCFDRISSALLIRLFDTGFSTLSDIKVNHQERAVFLADMMDYYKFHMEGFGNIKSLGVLSEIYRDSE
jgi:DNA repair protein RecO (recombination protein O)